MKRIFAVLFALVIALSTSFVAYAETMVDADSVFSEYDFGDFDEEIDDATVLPHFVDGASLLDMTDAYDLNQYIADKSMSLGFDIVIVTVDTLDGKTPQEYADDYYDYNGYGFGEEKDGCLLLVSMEDRDWHISTTGYGIVALTDAGLDYISDQFLPYLSDGEYYDAFVTFTDTVSDFVLQSDTGEPYDIGNMGDLEYNNSSSDSFNFRALIYGLVIGLIFASIFTARLTSKLKTVRHKTDANDYLVANSFTLTHESERFVGKTLTKTPIPKESSSGGSSTHSGSSGTSHGGSGGKF